jgi:glycosyltransferase involved in cell wall biosynthesis
MQKHVIFIFANLKPSQVLYKVLPLSRSDSVEKVIILRKEFVKIDYPKIDCIAIPGIFKFRPLYWIFVPIYGIYLIKRNHVSLILNYNIFPHGFNAFFASIFTRRPVIFSEINEDTIKYHQKFYLKPIINSILSNARYITVPGSRTQNYWLKSGFSNVTKLHSTINIDYFTPSNEFKTIDFIYIGEFDENKRPEYILEAFVAVRETVLNASLCLIGYGEKQPLLEKKISAYNLNDSISIVKSNDVLAYLRRSKIFVMASLTEGIPCALLESMSCELIAVVPAVGDIADVIDHGVNGFIHNNNKEELIKYMTYSLENYNSLDILRISARETIINGHSYKVAIAKWNELLGC